MACTSCEAAECVCHFDVEVMYPICEGCGEVGYRCKFGASCPTQLSNAREKDKAVTPSRSKTRTIS